MAILVPNFKWGIFNRLLPLRLMNPCDSTLSIQVSFSSFPSIA
ncbi:hypothetical protein HMPREF0322_04502 [Desulfitobacterium hafniense DP7]|uniref:Uncharacterized protein n=1 Tax=Desulfitobacterium hafniense DP7 TaxID=537010 RepID=G9XU45_DESHA|nr:hypothetical protein HMPREF0322_04502 [Desulfitobacterium hafniense DP7]